MSKTYSISELASEFDVTVRSIRFYEDQGLLHPSRRGQTRVYSSKDRVRLKLIRGASGWVSPWPSPRNCLICGTTPIGAVSSSSS